MPKDLFGLSPAVIISFPLNIMNGPEKQKARKIRVLRALNNIDLLLVEVRRIELLSKHIL